MLNCTEQVQIQNYKTHADKTPKTSISSHQHVKLSKQIRPSNTYCKLLGHAVNNSISSGAQVSFLWPQTSILDVEVSDLVREPRGPTVHPPPPPPPEPSTMTDRQTDRQTHTHTHTHTRSRTHTHAHTRTHKVVREPR